MCLLSDVLFCWNQEREVRYSTKWSWHTVATIQAVVYILHLQLTFKDTSKILILPVSLNANILGSQNVHCTWCIYDMTQRIAWWWLLRVEICRYIHNLTIINTGKIKILSVSLNVNILGSQNVHCTWYIYDMVQQIVWWLLGVETCRYMHNLTIINRCVWLKMYILSN